MDELNLSRLQLDNCSLAKRLAGVSNPSRVQSLNLSGNNKITRWPPVKFPALEGLNLSKCARYADAITNTLASCQGLITLILECCCMHTLTNSIANYADTLRLLNMRGNRLAHVPKSIAKMKRLVELNLCGNRLADSSIDFICNLIRFQLARLNLANNKIGVLGARHIARSLVQASTLKMLVLAGNPAIGDHGAASIFSAIAHRTRYTMALRTLRLDACNISDMSARVLVAAIRATRSLQILSMGRNRLSNETMFSLSRVLEDQRSRCGISELDLSDNLLRADGAVAVAATILQNDTLLYLNLSGNDSLLATIRATVALADSIARNKVSNKIQNTFIGTTGTR